MGYCDDCGCRTSNGICSNCQEELYIYEFQSEYIDHPVSDEFNKKAIEQEVYLSNKKRLTTQGVK